jgi:hypothetical protein
VSLLSPFSSLVMQLSIFLTKLSDESIIFIIDVGKKCTFVKISKKKIEKAYKRIITLLKKSSLSYLKKSAIVWLKAFPF